MKNEILTTQTTWLKYNKPDITLGPEKYAAIHPAGRPGKLCGFNALRHSCLTLTLLLLTVCAFIPSSHAQTSKQHYGISVAVLPFEVFSIEKEPTLGSDVATLIEKHLVLNPSIICIDDQQIKSVMQPDEYVAVSADRLKQLAKLLNANFIIMGTVTKIRSEHSIDVEMFNTASSGPHIKTFSEGIEIESLVETIATTLDQEIMDSAEQIPTIERPRVSATRQTSPQNPSKGFDVERELVAAFGPIKDSPPNTTGTAPVKTEIVETIAPTITEEPLQGEPETTAPQKSEPSGTVPYEPVPIKKDTADSPEEKPAKSKKDPGFFSFSKAININSDTMEYDNKANKGIFKGNVVARQGDIVMFANSMHVSYSKDGGLSRVDARGNVRVVQGDRIATGSNILFNNATQTIIATGDPRVWQGDNVVHGQKITVYLKEERTVVEGKPDSRASATIHPKSDKKLP